jgi:opacity protein-like surface antigen
MKILLTLLLIGFSGVLRAQTGELWFSGGASVLTGHQLGSTAPDGKPADVLLFNGHRVGIRFGFNSDGHIGHEIQYAYNRTDLLDNTGVILTDNPRVGMAFHQAGYNFLYYFTAIKEGSKIRPFVTGGAHFSDFVLPGKATTQGSSVKAGFNYGVGVKVGLSTLFAFRLDLRQYETGKPSWGGLLVNQSGLLHQTEASAGLGIYF